VPSSSEEEEGEEGRRARQEGFDDGEGVWVVVWWVEEEFVFVFVFVFVFIWGLEGRRVKKSLMSWFERSREPLKVRRERRPSLFDGCFVSDTVCMYVCMYVCRWVSIWCGKEGRKKD